MNILAIDVGGTHVKVLASNEHEPRKFNSGPSLTPSQFVKKVKHLTRDWTYSAVTIGYPGLVAHGRIVADPKNLGKGWVGFDFGKAFACPAKILNDAAMQAIGSYEGGRMLFLGVGTGLGSAMIVGGHLEPMELAHLPYGSHGRTFEDYVGVAGRQRLGERKWRKHVWTVLETLRGALEPDYVVLGGGNAVRLGRLPPGVRLGNNTNAFVGGFRVWRKLGRARAKPRQKSRASSPTARKH